VKITDCRATVSSVLKQNNKPLGNREGVLSEEQVRKPALFGFDNAFAKKAKSSKNNGIRIISSLFFRSLSFFFIFFVPKHCPPKTLQRH
jgi:hypothetical protein